MLALGKRVKIKPSEWYRESSSMSLEDDVRAILNSCSLNKLRQLIHGESSLTTAMILTYIQKEDRARIIKSLPRPLLKDVIKKMITLHTLQPVLTEGILTGVIRKAQMLQLPDE